MSKRGGSDENIYRIPPYFYIHVLDQNTNVTRLVVGPKTFIRQDNEKVCHGPEKMTTVPPRHYCIIENPVIRNMDGKPVSDDSGSVKLRFADQEVRLSQDPFPLYPGEVLKQAVQPLKVVQANTALRLRAMLDFETEDGQRRVAGDEWLFEGPGVCGVCVWVCGYGCVCAKGQSATCGIPYHSEILKRGFIQILHYHHPGWPFCFIAASLQFGAVPLSLSLSPPHFPHPLPSLQVTSHPHLCC